MMNLADIVDPRRAKGPRGFHIDRVADAKIGAKIRQFRRFIELTQVELAEKMGISYQQLQKIEKGTNRISADMLFKLCDIFVVEADFFRDPSKTLIKHVQPRLGEEASHVLELFHSLASQKDKDAIISIMERMVLKQ
jgi:transcriptional regulator with XRE-family HTH domain